MKTFLCVCGQRLMFENVFCLNCKHTLGYIPDAAELCAFELKEDGEWHALSTDAPAGRHKMCANYEHEQACNWMIEADDPNPLCRACRLNRTIPDLSDPENPARWRQVESAKRRLLYTLIALGLPVVDKQTDPVRGIIFDFLADTPGGPRVLTGHDEGVITINVAEAQADVREKMRREMGEKYRTVVGHFRHEIGHHYWNVLIRDTADLEPFRQLFGDDRADYQQALKRNYEQGPPEDWQEHFISAYASSHPWEDWAETWGNYLHMIDTLESARDAGLIVEYPGRNKQGPLPDLNTSETFEEMLEAWFPLTFALNNINRSLGHADTYPFVLSEEVIRKLRFVHDVIKGAGSDTSSQTTRTSGG